MISKLKKLCVHGFKHIWWLSIVCIYPNWGSNCPIPGQWKLIQIGPWDHTTQHYLSLRASLLSRVIPYSRHILYFSYLRPVISHLFKGDLIPFSEKWYLETTVWVLGGAGCLFSTRVREFSTHEYLDTHTSWVYTDASNSNSGLEGFYLISLTLHMFLLSHMSKPCSQHCLHNCSFILSHNTHTIAKN